MLAVFRTDASGQIGTGHVVRCLTLADALKQSGVDCQFICRALPGELAETLRARGHSLHMLPLAETAGEVAQTHDHAQPRHALWLGADWETDAAQTLAAIDGNIPDWLIVDHYAIDERWERTLRSGCRRLMVIDDLADRQHDCDLLLDQNLIAGWQHRYDDKVADDCELLLGPSYALLQPIYADLRPRVPPREVPVRRILVYFGGADTDNLTGKAVSALISLGRDVDVDVVINPAHDHAPAIRAAVGSHSSMVLHEALPSLAPLMVSADLAIGASGTNSWERCCLGLPTLVVTLAENQKPIAAELDRLGLIRLLGHKDDIDVPDLAREIGAVLDGQRPFVRVDGPADIDGEGAKRVVAALLLRETLKARPAVVEDESLLRRWRRTKTAVADADMRLFRASLRSLDRCHIFIVETADGFPVAQVRFDAADAGWVVDTVFAPLARRFMLDNASLVTAIAALRKMAKGVLTFLPATQALLKGRKESQSSGVRSLKIAICSDAGSWINDTAAELVTGWLGAGHCVSWVHAADDLPGGDLCFYLSYGRIVGEPIRSRYRHNLIVHASDLPKGRGWSPASWLILGGAERIPVTLFEAVDAVDAGPIYLQDWIDLDGTELIDDWRAQVAQKTHDLANAFVASYPGVLEKVREQVGEPTMYPRRRAQDSLLDSEQSIAAQFNQLRIVDNESYPAFFRHNGKEFILKILPR